MFLRTDAAKLEAQADVSSDSTGVSDLRGTAEIKSITPKGQSSILSEMTVNDSQSFTCTSTTQYVCMQTICKLVILGSIKKQQRMRYGICMILNNEDLIYFLFEKGAGYFEEKKPNCMSMFVLCV